MRQWIAGTFLALGGIAGLVGVTRYNRADQAIRRGDLPRGGKAPVLITVAVAVVALVWVILVALDVWA